MNKIAVIFTGGTISCKKINSSLNVNKDTQYELTSRFLSDEIQFTYYEPYYILSENATSENAVTLINQINEISKHKYDGIIITHGTDTLAWMVPIVAFACKDVNLPICFVSAGYPLDDYRTNGFINFECALILITQNVKNGVYTCYKNYTNEYVSVFYGTRFCEASFVDDAFQTVNNYLFAKYENGTFDFINTSIVKTNHKFDMNFKCGRFGLFLYEHLGLKYTLFTDEMLKNIDYVLVSGYHSGTFNTSKNKDYSVYSLIERLSSQNKRLYICNVWDNNSIYGEIETLYSNVCKMGNVLPNVALSKLFVAYNFIKESEREEFINCNINGEIM